MELNFGRKTAVVTGGANGIGWAIATQLAASGASVAILDLERENPAEKARQIGASGFAVNVLDPASLDAALDQIGIPEIAMINAGTCIPAGIFDTTHEIWNRTIGTNLSGAFFTLQTAARRMRDARIPGSIVFTASTNSYDGEPNLIAYNASKAALLGIVHTAANELGRYGIRVNAVCPGFIRTRLTEAHFQNPDLCREYFRDLPLGRGGAPEEVARAAVFLASDAASYITGATLLVDGGQMATKFGIWNESDDHFEDGRWRRK